MRGHMNRIAPVGRRVQGCGRKKKLAICLEGKGTKDTPLSRCVDWRLDIDVARKPFIAEA